MLIQKLDDSQKYNTVEILTLDNVLDHPGAIFKSAYDTINTAVLNRIRMDNKKCPVVVPYDICRFGINAARKGTFSLGMVEPRTPS